MTSFAVKPGGEHRFYNPDPEAREPKFNTEIIRCVGRDEKWADPKTGQTPYGPGETPVRPASSAKHVDLSSSKMFVEKRTTPDECILHLLGADLRSGKMGAMGMRLMTPWGDQDGTNEKARQEARETFAAFRLQDDLALTSAFRNEIKVAQERGLVEPQPSGAVLAAFKRLADQGKTVRFKCPVCRLGFPEEAPLARHMAEYHPLEAAEQPVRKKPGPKPKPRPEAVGG